MHRVSRASLLWNKCRKPDAGLPLRDNRVHLSKFVGGYRLRTAHYDFIVQFSLLDIEISCKASCAVKLLTSPCYCVEREDDAQIEAEAQHGREPSVLFSNNTKEISESIFRAHSQLCYYEKRDFSLAKEKKNRV